MTRSARGKVNSKGAGASPPSSIWPFVSRLAGAGAALAVLALVVLLIQMNANNAGATDKGGSGFAADRGGGEETPVPFDGKRALSYLEKVCAIGPRMSDTEGMKKQQELLETHFTDLGGKVTYQKFTARQRSVRKPAEMANMVVSWFPDRAKRVIVCSHYDTRPVADQEPNPRRWHDPFVSANDGGSGVALLMELAHAMKDLKTEVGVDFVFFDGEEYIWDPTDDEYFFGSKHFAREYAKVRRKVQYKGAILLDMVGAKGARFPIEQNSWTLAAGLTREVWGIAEELKCGAFTTGFSKTPVLDDHMALNRVGIPAVDIIDFEYPHWHRLSDVPKNCSAEPLEQVAKVVSVWLQRAK